VLAGLCDEDLFMRWRTVCDAATGSDLVGEMEAARPFFRRALLHVVERND
jgi:hypothetical protein